MTPISASRPSAPRYRRVGLQVRERRFGHGTGQGIRFAAQDAAGHDEAHRRHVHEQRRHIQRIGDDVDGFKVRLAQHSRDFCGGRAGIQNDGLAVADQGDGLLRDAHLLRVMLELLDAERLVRTRFLDADGAAVGADERAGRLERGEVGADGDLRGAEAHGQCVDHHASFFAQELADPPAAFFDQETGFGRIHHQTRIASISKYPWKAILSCGSVPDPRASAPDTSPYSRSLT